MGRLRLGSGTTRSVRVQGSSSRMGGHTQSAAPSARLTPILLPARLVADSALATHGWCPLAFARSPHPPSCLPMPDMRHGYLHSRRTQKADEGASNTALPHVMHDLCSKLSVAACAPSVAAAYALTSWQMSALSASAAARLLASIWGKQGIGASPPLAMAMVMG
jgi:hypothetical protein